MHEAQLYETLDNGGVQCHLCGHQCKLNDGKIGICQVRQNQSGTLFSLVYGKIIAEHIDPIEKKPLFHFFPGCKVYSIGTVGCNFRCRHCQNFHISQYPRQHHGEIIGKIRTPQQIVQAAILAKSETIAYTYTEPTIFFEFAYDTAILAKESGLRNVFVSNGYMSPQAAKRIAPHLDAINVDLKSFDNDFYKKICGARLDPVLETIQLVKELGLWLEVTTLIIPGLNDQEQELRNIARFIKGVGSEVPWHISQFFPTYQLSELQPTPAATLHRAREIGREEGLRYVYEGNLAGQGFEDTYCHSCQSLLIQRKGNTIRSNRLNQGKCPQCGTLIDGVGM